MLYRHYPLAEGALVAEICNLIHANLPDDWMLTCEMQYEKLLPGAVQPSVLTQRARADLVVSKKASNVEDWSPAFVIEVKRADAPKGQIDSDLRRLAAVRDKHRRIRTFMFVISEADRPKRFVYENGSSRKGKHDIPNSDGYFRVRRTWKAAHALTKGVPRIDIVCFFAFDADSQPILKRASERAFWRRHGSTPRSLVREVQAITVREPDSPTDLKAQHSQLLSEGCILCFKAPVRLEWRGQYGQCKKIAVRSSRDHVRRFLQLINHPGSAEIFEQRRAHQRLE